MAIFYNMLDIRALNNLIIWMSLNPDSNRTARCRRLLFLLELGKKLCCSGRSSEPVEINLEVGPTTSAAKLPLKRGRCNCCVRQEGKKAAGICSLCSFNVCNNIQRLFVPSATDNMYLCCVYCSNVQRTFKDGL